MPLQASMPLFLESFLLRHINIYRRTTLTIMLTSSTISNEILALLTVFLRYDLLPKL